MTDKLDDTFIISNNGQQRLRDALAVIAGIQDWLERANAGTQSDDIRRATKAALEHLARLKGSRGIE